MRPRSMGHRLLALLAMAGLAACQAAADEQAAPHVPGATRAWAGTTITWYADSLPQGLAINRRLVDRFTADTGIRVQVIPRLSNTLEAFATFARLFDARRPDVDVLMLDLIWLGAFAPHLLDLGSALGGAARAHSPMLVRNNTVGGKLLAMPWYPEVGVLYYRRDLLERDGFRQPPATFDELERMARLIQQRERERNARFVGYVWPGSPAEGLTCTALEWQVNQGGGAIMGPEGRADLDNPRALAAFRRAAGWLGSISPPTVLTANEDDVRRVFQAGNAAFLRGWSSNLALMEQAGSPIAGRIGMAALPHARGLRRSHGTLGGWQLGVSAHSAHPDAAIALVRYLASPEVETYRAKVGSFLPTIESLYDDRQLVASRPVLATFRTLLHDAVARPSIALGAQYPALSAIYIRGVSAILHGNMPEVTGALMQHDARQLLQQPAPPAGSSHAGP